MGLVVHIALDAERDMEGIHWYVSQYDCPEAADRLLNRLERTCMKLEELPNRGQVVPELQRVGVTDFRQVHFKPYRIVYQVEGNVVIVLAVLDGRRNLQSLLERRLLR